MTLPAEVRDEAPENLQEKRESVDAAASATGNPKSGARNCLVCGHALRTRFARVLDAKTLETFSILECPACGLGSTEPNPKDLSKYYRDYHGGRHGITNSFCTRRRIRLLQNAAGNQSGKRLLDIGCGEGTFLLAAKAKGWSVAGTEMNPSSALSAGLVIYSQLSEVRALAPFDCITLWHSLEHMPDPRATLQEARSLLSPDGIVIIAVPDAGGLQARIFGPKWLHLDVPRHLYHFTRRSLDKLLRHEGFAPLRRWHQEFEYDLLGWSQSALNFGPTAPNLFFDLLTGRTPAVGRLQRISTWVVGSALTGFAIVLVPLGTLAKRGGTIIVVARAC